MALTSVEYAANGATDSFSIPFPYVRATDVKVSVNGVLVSPASYTIASALLTFTGSPPSGTLRIFRETDVDVPINRFSGRADLSGPLLDASDDQHRYRIQELETNLASIAADGTGSLPAASSAGSFVVAVSDGSGGYDWVTYTQAQVETLLGLSGATSVPDPTGQPNGRFIVTNAGSYALADAAAIRDTLDVAAVPEPSAATQFLSSLLVDGSYRWARSSATGMRGALGLGSASTRNTGTTAGTIPIIGSGDTLSGALNLDACKVLGAALSNLTYELVTLSFTNSGPGGNGRATHTAPFNPQGVLFTASPGAGDDRLILLVGDSNSFESASFRTFTLSLSGDTLTVDANGPLAGTVTAVVFGAGA